jgi:hypothetical protein
MISLSITTAGSGLRIRIRILSSLFAIEICSYSVMSYTIHLVVKLMPQEAEGWMDNDVLERWMHS